MFKLVIFVLLGSLPLGIISAILVSSMGLPSWTYYACLIFIGGAFFDTAHVLTQTFIRKRSPDFLSSEKVFGGMQPWEMTAGTGIVPRWVSLIHMLAFSSLLALFFPLLTSVIGISLPSFPLSSGAMTPTANVVSWALWVFALLWTGFSLIGEVFFPNPSVQPLGLILSHNMKRMILVVYVFGMSSALLVTAAFNVSRFHLLWFLPAFHFFGTNWIPKLFSRHSRSHIGQPVPTKSYTGPDSSLQSFPLLYAYFDDFEEIKRMASMGSLLIALHASDPRSCSFNIEQVLSDESLFLRLYADNLLRVKLSDGFEIFRRIEEYYWDEALHPEEYTDEMFSEDEWRRNLRKQIDVHVNAIRMRYGIQSEQSPTR